MPKPATFAVVVAGLIAGAGLALAGRALGDDPPPNATSTPPPTSATTTTPGSGTTAYWIAPGEVVLGPTVLIPGALSVEGSEVVFSYELHDIAGHSLGINAFADDDVPILAPERWTLLTTAGAFPGSTANTRARTARFAIDTGFDPATIRGLRLDGYRIRLPMRHRIDIAVDDTSVIELDERTTIALRIVLPQANNTIVQFRIEDPFDGFDSSSDGFAGNFRFEPQIRGVGEGWTNVGPTETGIQLTYTGGELPNPIPLTVTTANWVRTPVAVDIDITELLDE